MSDYSDILGYITDGQRVNVNGLDVALAVAPPVVPAGRPFQVLLLAQNTTNTPVELSAALSLPARDGKRQKDRFRTQKERVSLRVLPAEVGYLALPVACHAATAADDSYKVAVAVNARPLTQSAKLRSSASPAEPGTMTDNHRALVEKLRKLTFSVNKRFGRDELEAPFRVVGAKPGQNSGPKGGWNSLWNLAEDGTPDQLLSQYDDLIEEHLFPRLQQQQVFEPLRQTTEERFKAVGYPLKELETVFIAKLLTLVIHMANPGEDSYDYLGSQAFNVAVHVNQPDRPADIALPRWFEGLLRGVARDERVAAQPVQYLCARLYDSLIRDVVPFAFAMIETITGEDMGTPDEIRAYADNYSGLLQDGGMDFAHAYLPLVMGGVTVYDRVVLPDETLEDTLRGMSDVLAERDAEWEEANDLVFLLTRDLANRSLRLFGFQI